VGGQLRPLGRHPGAAPADRAVRVVTGASTQE
jgi:hypothetical protein